MKKIKIGLLLHSIGHANLGVDALSRANIVLLEEAATRANVDVKFITFGGGARSGVSAIDGVEFGPSPKLKRILLGEFELVKQIRQCDYIVDIGEGDSFTDIYGLKRFYFQILIKLLVIYSKIPLVLAPQTIGPFEKFLSKSLARFTMKKCLSVMTRDYESTKFVNAIGVYENTKEFIDVALALPYSKNADKDKDITSVGINVSGLLFNGGYTKNNQFELALDYKQYCYDLIEYFLGKENIKLILFGHVFGDGGADDDSIVIEKLKEKYPAIEIRCEFKSSVEAKTFVSSLDFVVAGRMHACIAAFSTGVPVVPVAYSRKFNGLFGSLNYPFYIDGRQCNHESALNKTIEWFENKDKLTESCAQGNNLAMRKLDSYVDFMSGIFSNGK